MSYFRNQFLVRANIHLDSNEFFYWKNATAIHFRRNRGDLQSIREVLIEEHYILPDFVSKTTLVDLGANIGLTSLWLTQRYGFKNVVAVEPVPENYNLLSKNLGANGIDASLINAAVGPHDGICFFEASSCSNQGRVRERGMEVRMISMDTVIKQCGLSCIDVVKLDMKALKKS